MWGFQHCLTYGGACLAGGHALKGGLPGKIAWLKERTFPTLRLFYQLLSAPHLASGLENIALSGVFLAGVRPRWTWQQFAPASVICRAREFVPGPGIFRGVRWQHGVSSHEDDWRR